MTFDGQWLNGQKHGPGFFRLSSSDHTSETVCFEVWSKGTLSFQKVLHCKWNNLPSMDDLPEYHSWKHIWACDDDDDTAFIVTGDNSAVPIVEDRNTVLEPFAEESTIQFAQTINPSVRLPNQRHYSVDFYSTSTSEEVKPCGKSRSCSFSSYLSNSSFTHAQNRRGQRSIVRKVQYCKGGFVVIVGVKKKIRVSKF